MFSEVRSRTLHRALYVHNAYIWVKNKKVSLGQDQLQVFASPPLLLTFDKSVTFSDYASPSSVPRVNHRSAPFFLTLGCSVFTLVCFFFLLLLLWIKPKALCMLSQNSVG